MKRIKYIINPKEAEAKEEGSRDDAQVGVVKRRDPLEMFGNDIMSNILTYLDPRSGARSILVSHAWHLVASDDRLWTSKCEELWLGKAHMPRLLQFRGLSRLAAYSMSATDGKRERIMRDDLCDHVWEFHFHKDAPEYWRNHDPYWRGTGSLMHRHFHPDGSQTADHGDEVWGGHESCYCTVTGMLLGNGHTREHYVRINRWPELFVFRNQDWSWEMSNNLCSYTSIPDSDKAGGTGPLFVVR